MKPGLCPDFPFIVNDWLSSGRVSTMSPAQECGYFRLLLYAWNEPDCTLPDDPEVLAEWSRLRGDWTKLGAKVRACFVPDPARPGRIFNEKQRAVRSKQNERIEAAKLHGRKAAVDRWEMERQRKKVLHGTMPGQRAGTAGAMPEHYSPNASYSAPLARLPVDKACSTKGATKAFPNASATKRGGKLSTPQKFLADRIEAALGKQWVNDAGKWIGLIKSKPPLAERIIAELEDAVKNNRINTTPAQYAHDVGKQFGAWK